LLAALMWAIPSRASYMDATYAVPIVALVSSAAIWSGIWLFRLARRLRRPLLSVADFARLAGRLPPALPCRFEGARSLQRHANDALTFKSEEEHLVDVFEDQVGSVIAIAHPSERLSLLGAYRLRVVDSERWRAASSSVMNR
jgi:hypothetical protein